MKKLLSFLMAGWLILGGWMPASAESIGQSWFINSGDAEKTVPLYEGPGKAEPPIGALFSGTEVIYLENTSDGWVHVQVADLDAYIEAQYLDRSAAGVSYFRPPMQPMKEGATADICFSINGGQADAVLTAYDPAWILGIFGDQYLVQFETWISENETGMLVGYAPASAFEEGKLKSASTLGFALRDAPTYHWPVPDRPEPTGDRMPKGATFTIVSGRVSSSSERENGYLIPEDHYLRVLVYDPDGTAYTVWLGIEDVSFDPGLMLPEIMSLG